MNCPKCGSERTNKNGHEKNGDQKYVCLDCGYYFPVKKDGNQQVRAIVENLKGTAPEKINGNGIINETELRAKYDYSFIIKKALDELKPGQFREKESLLSYCKLKPNNEVLALLKSEQFGKYRGMAKNSKLIFGHPDRIKILIEDTTLDEI